MSRFKSSRIRASPRNVFARRIHSDGRTRLSRFWTPTHLQSDVEDLGLSYLLRGGFLRRSNPGLFHLLPLGVRVQSKLEGLVDNSMRKLGASKISLSSITSEELWHKSGRLGGAAFFRTRDRKGGKYLLAPTHEEEVTDSVKDSVVSYKQLPLRLYQVTRKYRDEERPRLGLLRGREFVMKDLYTFDASDGEARGTYELVREAYGEFFRGLKVPFMVADADSGTMGGKLSHEFHFESEVGEDVIVRCEGCGYCVNEEVYWGWYKGGRVDGFTTWSCLSKDRKTALLVMVPRRVSRDSPNGDVNVRLIQRLFPECSDPVIAEFQGEDECSLGSFSKVEHIKSLTDPRVLHHRSDWLTQTSEHIEPVIDGELVTLTKAQDGDTCPKCKSGQLRLHSAIELGHTFHLGTRYSEPLDFRITTADNQQVPVSMGCHGIGISRLIGAIASKLADSKGLNWPLSISPFNVIILPLNAASESGAATIYDELLTKGFDAAIDDRDQRLGWKLKDADLIGYPFILVLGKAWQENKMVELQCRRLGIKENISTTNLLERITHLASNL
ncbi:prolyl-tRNA synthetase [Piedraia hortae CBS 480.64]|uniref:proline--tRNA ligase n=1 Tax=Piedraia hortae CBS 480.64 TaxID=1314780 RepID=A0A6A7C5S4_9PEZI|nr:prolyl-tRNA synthetase [Piedraia hortae CBS 480.64]